jgi:hypothetical protein
VFRYHRYRLMYLTYFDGVPKVKFYKLVRIYFSHAASVGHQVLRYEPERPSGT